MFATHIIFYVIKLIKTESFEECLCDEKINGNDLHLDQD